MAKVLLRVDVKNLEKFIDSAIGLLTEAKKADPSRNVMGPAWHDRYEEARAHFQKFHCHDE